jgi:hypothetical protein
VPNALVNNPDGQPGITLHVNVDEDIGAAELILIRFKFNGPGATDDFNDFKQTNFGTSAQRNGMNAAKVLAAKRLAYRYAIFGWALFGGGGATGTAELFGNDFLITLGGTQNTEAQQSGTFMHELGHTLGLRHGGPDAINCKPNYLSIMSYSRQFPNLLPARPLDYSRAALNTLDETALIESNGIGVLDPTVYGDYAGNPFALGLRTSQAIDWNVSGGINGAPVNADINYITAAGGCPASPTQQLLGYDDWSHLWFNFHASADFADGASPSSQEAYEVTADQVSLLSQAAAWLDEDGDDLIRSVDTDDDNDGCTDGRELGLLAQRGGKRDPLSFWDVMDQWIGGNRDKAVSGGDIGAVVARFGSMGDPAGNPLTPPAGSTGYHVIADRNGAIPGQNVWNLRPPNGSISGGDIAGVVAQFGHSCVPANKIAFHSNRDTGGTTYEIYTMNANGTGVTRLTNNSVDDTMPSWSPDGSKIVFDSMRDGNSEIYVMNADGTNQTRLTYDPAGDFDPTWSPDSQQIAFVSERDFNREIYTMNADGSSQTNRTNNFAFDADPDWSPDGLQIAFVSDRTGNFDVYVMSPTGENQNDLINNPAYFDTFPAWSPSGQHITFQSNRNGDMEVFQITGEIQANLTNFPGANDGATMPWSPDETKIAFSSDRDGNAEIYVMDANGTGQTRLTNDSASDGAPDWSP